MEMKILIIEDENSIAEIMKSYNPEGFSYGSNGSAYDYNFSNPNDAYFLSYYSRQSYLEDRAVLFSDMMTRATKDHITMTVHQ